MRRYFKDLLFYEMEHNKDIVVLTGDLGFGMFDHIRDIFPTRFYNTGASEQAMMDIAVGLALAGKIPVVYSITPFLLWRAAETIRTYIAEENIKVLLVGGGRDKDYKEDGWSHDASDTRPLLDLFPSIKQYWPLTTEDIDVIIKQMIVGDGPSFISLKR